MMESPDFGEQRHKDKTFVQRIMLSVGLLFVALLFFVIYSVFNRGNLRAAAPPETIKYEASESIDEELEAKANKIAEAATDEYDEYDEDEYDSARNNTVYPPPAIPEQRQVEHNARIMAANAGTALAGFTSGKAEAIGENSEEKKSNYIDVDEITSNISNISISPQKSDPNGWADKARFISEGGKLLEGYSSHFRTPPVSELEIKAGTVIPCVLISGINSDLPGNSIGQVTENVYDSASGKNLLIPKGTRVIGTYDNHITYGQSRVLVVWSKLVYPDGSTLMLGNLTGVDQSGYTGSAGQVNRHWNSLLASSLLVSLMGAGVDIATPSNRSDEDDAGSILAENATRAVAEAMSKVIEREADRQATIKIKPGQRYMLFVRQDIAFAQKWK